MRYRYLYLLLLLSLKGYAQCKSGNCNTGRGIYDFGWCVYEGEFKNEKPEGTGKMTYDNGTYEGEFRNGVEDGRGIFTYKNGTREKVMYSAGKRVSFEPMVVKAGELKPLEGTDPNCISGNCITGFGIYQFPSGNKYTGNFKNRKREGKGTFYFANKEEASGTFSNDNLTEGTYKFNNGYRYQGTWSKGEFYTGTFTSPSGTTAAMREGKVVVPPASEVLAGKGNGQGGPKCAREETCPHCHGSQIESKPIVVNHSFTISNGYNHSANGQRSDMYYLGGTTRTTSEIPNYVPCTRCGGKGTICKAL